MNYKRMYSAAKRDKDSLLKMNEELRAKIDVLSSEKKFWLWATMIISVLTMIGICLDLIKETI